MFFFYGTLQAIKLFKFGDTDIMESSRDTFFSDEFIFSGNMWFAFAITAYDSNQESIEDPSIGTLNAYYKTWGLGEDQATTYTPIPSRPCTEAELHANGNYNGEGRFWNPHSGAQGDLDFYWRKFRCLDVDQVEVQGDYNAAKARQFVLLFHRCNPQTYNGVCKPDHEITEWIRRKFIVILQN